MRHSITSTTGNFSRGKLSQLTSTACCTLNSGNSSYAKTSSPLWLVPFERRPSCMHDTSSQVQDFGPIGTEEKGVRNHRWQLSKVCFSLWIFAWGVSLWGRKIKNEFKVFFFRASVIKKSLQKFLQKRPIPVRNFQWIWKFGFNIHLRMEES